MIIAVAREIKDFEKIILGVGLPTTAGGLAKALHAPNCVLMTEAGIIDFKPLVPPNHIADVMCLRGFSYALDLFNTFTTINYRGFVDKAILGVGQVDRYGNINTSFMGGTAKTGNAAHRRRGGSRLYLLRQRDHPHPEGRGVRGKARLLHLTRRPGRRG